MFNKATWTFFVIKINKARSPKKGSSSMIIQNANFLVIKEWKQEVQKNNNAVVRCIEVGKSKST